MSSPDSSVASMGQRHWVFRPASLVAFAVIVVCFGVAGFLFAHERFTSQARSAANRGMLSTEGQGRVPVAETLRDWKVIESLATDVQRKAGKWSEQDIAQIKTQVRGVFFVADRTTVTHTHAAPGRDDVIEVIVHDGEHAGKRGWTLTKWFGAGKSLETAVRAEGVETLKVDGPLPTIRRSAYVLRWLLVFAAACVACGFGVIVYRYRQLRKERDHLDDLYEHVLASRLQVAKERDRIQLTMQFLIDILAVGGDVTVRKMLDHAAERIDAEFAKTPDIVPHVLMAIAGAYRSCGDRHTALELYTRAENIAAKVIGADSDVTLTARYNRAAVLDDLRQHDQAEEIHRSVLSRRLAVLGPTHPHTMGSMHALSVVLIHQKKYDQAQHQLEALLESQQRSLGPHHAETSESRHLLASVLSVQGRYDPCERLLRRSVESCREHHGVTHEQTFAAVNDLSHVLIESGKITEAIDMLEQVLRQAVKSLGATHVVTTTTAYLLGMAYSRQGQYERAEQLLAQSLECRRKLLGDGHRLTQMSQVALAKVMAIQGKTPPAHSMQISIPSPSPTTERRIDV
jgi:tetratricopeptide (TPR) repeat protein